MKSNIDKLSSIDLKNEWSGNAKDRVVYENIDFLLVDRIFVAKQFYYRKLIYFLINLCLSQNIAYHWKI